MGLSHTMQTLVSVCGSLFVRARVAGGGKSVVGGPVLLSSKYAAAR
jgi:hypothetical protein